MCDLLFTPNDRHRLTSEEIRETIDNLLENDTEIMEIRQHISRIPIRLQNINDKVRALYHIGNQEIWINQEQFSDRDELREALLHECIHAYDHKVKKIDISKPEGLATTEIHAAAQCECRNAWFRKCCTRDKAVEAVGLSMKNEKSAKKVVDSIFDKIYDEFSHDLPNDDYDFDFFQPYD